MRKWRNPARCDVDQDNFGWIDQAWLLEAKLTTASLEGANPDGADFSSANLSGTMFEYSQISGIVVEGINLMRAELDERASNLKLALRKLCERLCQRKCIRQLLRGSA